MASCSAKKVGRVAKGRTPNSSPLARARVSVATAQHMWGFVAEFFFRSHFASHDIGQRASRSSLCMEQNMLTD